MGGHDQTESAVTLGRNTQTEVRLAEALVAGLSPGEYAADAGVSMNTVRTQIRSMFEKTRTRRQADLVKLLTSLPAIRLDGEIL
ncbi:helix-turn-helix transcriptional regulator [Methylococcus sp. ANG]